MMRAIFSALLLAAPLASAHRWYNWRSDLTCEATEFFVPTSEEDLSNFLKAHPNDFIKVVGNGHAIGNMTTCVDVAASNRSSYVVHLTNLNDIEYHDDYTVTIGSGWDLIDLVPELKEHGVGVLNLGSERVQTFVGAASTGTHGTGKHLGNIGSHITALRVLDSSGNVHIINSTHNAELLDAYRVNMGLVGIITQVTIQGEPVRYLKKVTRTVEPSENLTAMFESFYDLYQQNDRLMIMGPYMDWDYQLRNWTFQNNFTIITWEDTNITDVNNCTVNYCSNDCGKCKVNQVCYEEASMAISTSPAGVCNRMFSSQFEHFQPVENLVASGVDHMSYLWDLANTKAQEIDGVYKISTFWVIRFIKGDDAWMSPVNKYNIANQADKYSGVFASIETDWHLEFNNFPALWFWQEQMQGVIPSLGEKHNVRPHWGKMSWFDETYAEIIYPQIGEFLALHEKMDPNCQFVNDFLVNHLGIDRCRGYFDSSLVPSYANLKMREIDGWTDGIVA